MSERDGIKLIDQLPKDFDTKAHPVRTAPFSFPKALAFLSALAIVLGALITGTWNR